MNPVNNTSRILGLAFLLQAITSLTSGLILKKVLIVPGNTAQSMINIASHVVLMRVDILIDIVTACGIIFLGAMLFLTLRKRNEKLALVALGFYILEATLIAGSRIAAFALLRVSQEFASAGQPASLLPIGKVASESMDFVGMTLSMAAFCLGAIPFYYLLYRSRIVPRALALWGLVAVFPCLAGTLFSLFGYDVPFAVYLPYAPFEFVVGIWILLVGIKESAETYTSPARISARPVVARPY